MNKVLEKVNIIPPIEPEPAAATPMTILERAVQSGASVETLEKLMGLQERWEANQARRSFDEAVANAKAEIPAIARNREGHNSKRYADFAAISEVVDPILTKHGLSYRFRTSQGERISVTCVLSHKSGHSEETTLTGPADATGNKNAIQAIGSTLTYLQRYSLVQMLGLSVANDDDGKAGGSGETISEEQAVTIVDMIEAVGGDRAKLCAHFKVATINDIPARDYDRVIAALKKKVQQ